MARPAKPVPASDVVVRESAAMEALRDRTGMSSQEICIDALALYDLVRQMIDEGVKIVLHNPDGTTEPFDPLKRPKTQDADRQD